MRICGFNKTTLLDYPGKVASTIFLGGCNFRCPFCQNGILVVAPGEQPDYSQEELLTFLKKRKGILDGVCISGGEPTLSDGLEEFLGKIKELGYAVKLDTNGSRPKIVKHLAEAGLIDKVAMDIKACPDNYGNLTGIEKPDMDSIFETADFLLHGNLDYEFRTTVVRELHTQKDFEEIAGWLERKNIICRLIRTQMESSGLDMEAILLKNFRIFRRFFKRRFYLWESGASIKRYQ